VDGLPFHLHPSSGAMPFRELIVLLPCHGLDDFPLYLEGPAADNLLAAWTALWHPALIHSAGHMPTWLRADDPPPGGESRLIIVPEVSRPLLAEGWIEQAQASGAVVLWSAQKRGEYVSAALALFPDDALRGGTFAQSLAEEFHALGYAYLMIELLARQMRYLTTVDLVQFENQTTAAAAAALREDEAAARDHLGKAFDVLAEARDRFYPTTAWLIDLTLVAPTTVGANLRHELEGPSAKNVLISASTLEEMERRAPDTVAALKLALAEERATLVGGCGEESEWPLLLAEQIARRLTGALREYERILGKPPKVFGRRRAGLSAVLPGLLYKFGFQGALHVSFDDGRFPRLTQARGRWEGTDATAVDALFRAPLDAGRADTFLAYPRHMGGAMDHDYLATLCLAHWPGQGRPWLDDLRRAATFGPLLGKFALLKDYLAAIDTYGHLARHEADAYGAPYLLQDVAAGQADPISRHVRRDQLARQALTLETAAILLDVLRARTSAATDAARSAAEQWWLAEDVSAEDLRNKTSEQRAMLEAIGTEFVAALGPPAEGAATLTINPAGCANRGAPALGFGVHRESAVATQAAIGRELRLVNERLEVNIHPQTGGIGAIRRVGQRSNRLSQQVALRCADWERMATETNEARAPYSTMVAEQIEQIESTPDAAEFRSRGVLLDPDEQVIAKFQQTTRLVRGADQVDVRLTLEPEQMPAGNPWQNYYCARFAWADAAGDLRRSVGGSSHTTDLDRFEAPHFVELLGESGLTTILPRGLPYHRRDGLRRLDTLLVVPGETASEFQWSIGVDLANPLAAALATDAVRIEGQLAARPPAWLFQIDQPGVTATGWAPLVEEGKLVGFRVHLQETLGQMDTARLRSFRKLARARMADGLGANLMNLRIEEGEAVVMEYAAHEWFIVEAWWS
jgi:alpha-mannosidase